MQEKDSDYISLQKWADSIITFKIKGRAPLEKPKLQHHLKTA